jgi:hypothetical protein
MSVTKTDAVGRRQKNSHVCQNRADVGHQAQSGKAAGELEFMDDWYPIQVKQQEKVGRPDVDQFEAAMLRARRKKGFFVGFDFSSDALREVDAFFRREHVVIVPLTVREILDEHIAQKLA